MVKDKKNFYMNSYMVYLLAARATNYLGLYRKGSMQDPNAWPYIVYLGEEESLTAKQGIQNHE